MPTTATPTMTIAEADQRLARNEYDFVALMAKGDHHFGLGELRAAGSFFGMAVSVAQSGRPADALEAQRAIRAMQDIQQQFVRHLVESLASSGHSRADWHPRFAQSIAMMVGVAERPAENRTYPAMPSVYYYPGLPHVEFADTKQFAWREAVGGKVEQIAEEARTLLAGSGSFKPYVQAEADRAQGDMHGMLDNDDWSSLDLIEKGEPVDDHVRHAPVAYKTITEEVPVCTIPNRAPTLLLSLLKAGKRIPPHHGMLNPRYICHLPLIVPGDGALRLGTQKREWRFGELIAFDDTIEHEAWNHSAKDRLVLLFDVWRPELEEIEQAQIAALFTAVDSAR